MLDRNLAVLLSRLAGLLGQAVPAHRFGMMSRTSDGLMVDNLNREERLKAWWLARFPTAEIEAVEPKNFKPSDYPMLWVGAEAEQVLLVRGGSGRHRLTCQDADGNPFVLQMADARRGRLLRKCCLMRPALHMPLAEMITAPCLTVCRFMDSTASCTKWIFGLPRPRFIHVISAAASASRSPQCLAVISVALSAIGEST